MTDEMGGLDAQAVHERDDVASLLGNAHRSGGRAALTVAPPVEADEAATAADGAFDDERLHPVGDEAGVQEDHRFAGSTILDGQIPPIEIHELHVASP
jgi:hypothetical protein